MSSEISLTLSHLLIPLKLVYFRTSMMSQPGVPEKVYGLKENIPLEFEISFFWSNKTSAAKQPRKCVQQFTPSF